MELFIKLIDKEFDKWSIRKKTNAEIRETEFAESMDKLAGYAKALFDLNYLQLWEYVFCLMKIEMLRNLIIITEEENGEI